MNVLLTGSTGFVGKRLTQLLLSKGHQVTVLTRNASVAAIELGKECRYIQWDFRHQEVPDLAFEPPVQAVIHLMGENIAAKRWGQKQKQEILDSRVVSTEKVVRALAKQQQLGRPVDVFLSASAIGIYGPRGNEEVSESDEQRGEDFLSQVCIEWERAASPSAAFVQRQVLLRIGVVLGKGGGALDKMLAPFKLNLGGPLGDGKQYMSWIHLEDLCRLMVFAIEEKKLSGAVNGTSPRPVTNRVFTNTLAKVLGRFAIFPVPSLALNILLGDMAKMLLTGQKVLPFKALNAGFQFHYEQLEKALRNIIHEN